MCTNFVSEASTDQKGRCCRGAYLHVCLAYILCPGVPTSSAGSGRASDSAATNGQYYYLEHRIAAILFGARCSHLQGVARHLIFSLDICQFSVTEVGARHSFMLSWPSFCVHEFRGQGIERSERTVPPRCIFPRMSCIHLVSSRADFQRWFGSRPRIGSDKWAIIFFRA